MLKYPEQVDQLMDELRQLPGVGRRAAERMALALLEKDEDSLRALGKLISGIPDKVGRCPECGAIAEKGELCNICSSLRRDKSLLCVVEDMPQLFAVEKGGTFRGKYLVLGGRLSPLDGEDGSSLNLDLLRKRAASPEVKEIILALSPDVEGRATAAFLTEILSSFPVKLTRPALGLPAGSNLSFADSATISAAFMHRKEVE